MDKAVYSLVLSESVIAKVDQLAYSMGTSRSNLINQILAEYVGYETPEKRIQNTLRQVESLLSAAESFRILQQQSASMMSASSSLAFKYNPTIKYSVELSRNGLPEIGELRVSLRTQSSTLLGYMMQFYGLWIRAELSCRPNCEYLTDGGRMLVRKLRLNSRVDPHTLDSAALARMISDYIAAFDSAMKVYFYYVANPDRAAAEVEREYLSYYRRSGGVV